VKLITAVIRPDRLPFVKEALFRIGITGLSMWRVTGHGGEQEVVQHYRGTTVVHDFHEKVRLEMACSEAFVEPAIAAIIEGARTGEVGDGKIFVQTIDEVVRIRTGERNDEALTAVNAEAVQRKSIAYRVVVEETD
jgi:nitrogen regulatory protein P-II 1